MYDIRADKQFLALCEQVRVSSGLQDFYTSEQFVELVQSVADGSFEFRPQMVIGVIPCDSCRDGRMIPIQLNQNSHRNAYANCKTWDSFTGIKCARQHRYGKVHSQELKDQFLSAIQQLLSYKGRSDAADTTTSDNLEYSTNAVESIGFSTASAGGNESGSDSANSAEHGGLCGSSSGHVDDQRDEFLGC